MRITITNSIDDGDLFSTIDIEGEVSEIERLFGRRPFHPKPHSDQAMEKVMASLEQLRQAIARNTDVVSSGSALLAELTKQLRTALEDDDVEAAKALLAQIENNTDTLARAITESTAAQTGPASDPIVDPAAGTDTGGVSTDQAEQEEAEAGEREAEDMTREGQSRQRAGQAKGGGAKGGSDQRKR
jgi:hypothetical protein